MPQLFRPPNLLTCVRIVLTPVIVLALMRNDCERAFWLSLFAGFTDAADGYLARLMGESSRLGAYLDPIADKLLLTALYICFGAAGLAPLWLVYLVVGRDAMILSLVAAGYLWKGIRDFPPSIWGKLSTLLQIATALGVISLCSFGVAPGVVQVLLYATAAATFWSGLHYFLRAVASIRYVSR
ncbi:MAG TPA: CDP-alcohol phosphatidyltransferase family protein [Bryobacteraceae bacterium]|nr:CDP-alcohol phosphatidyltransferase family protein [Bryobacteraceae bacterium]